MSAEDWWEIAAEQLLGRLVDEGGIEMVTAHGVGALRGPLALHLLQLETGVEDQRPRRPCASSRCDPSGLPTSWSVCSSPRCSPGSRPSSYGACSCPSSEMPWPWCAT
jgi:hypothetical protein